VRLSLSFYTYTVLFSIVVLSNRSQQVQTMAEHWQKRISTQIAAKAQTVPRKWSPDPVAGPSSISNAFARKSASGVPRGEPSASHLDRLKAARKTRHETEIPASSARKLTNTARSVHWAPNAIDPQTRLNLARLQKLNISAPNQDQVSSRHPGL
jgi:hypothetical protein